MTRINGILIPLPTIFRDSGEVDHDGIRALIEFYVKAGVHGLFVLGTFGHGPALSPEERKQVASTVMKTVDGRVPTVIHVGCADTPTTIELAKDAVDKGADSIAVIPPYYFEHNDDEVLLHYTQVYKTVPHPLFVYNNWVNSGYRMSAAWAIRLSKEIPDLCGIKMSFLPLDQQITFVKALPSSCGVFSGSAIYLMPGVLWGLAGTIHPLTVAIPELLVKLWKSIEDKKLEDAVRLQGKVIDFTLTVMGLRQYGRSPMKDSLQMRDIPVKSFPRWPTKDLSSEDRKKLEVALKTAMAG